jgi:hypothetical protein
MNTPTGTATRAAPASSALATSAKFETFALTFAIVGTLAYCICLFFNLPLFSYHPAVNRFEWGWGPARSGEGPVMYWYSWTATTIIVSTIAGFLATLLPESMAKKVPLILVWLIPVLSIPFFIWDLRQWWFHEP